ncbi:hypothetical protein [Streptomyces sp. CC228A]|uniref:hypothetical protein n=1 Tax=Streptomyces sp. CC228A TaxID=2898186 RepID=UPI001F24F82B|nr:hypothetical protein [Streptomyces sp. CC228A]
MEQIKSEIDTIMAGVIKAIAAHETDHPTGRLPATGRTQIATALKTVRSYDTLLNFAHNEMEKLRLNDTLYPEGRKRMMQDLLTDAEQKTADKHRTADNNITVARASFITNAFPTLTRNREMIAREDARMILDGSNDPQSTLIHLAQRQDDVGALVVTAWGADYLYSRGCDDRDVKNAQKAIIAMAVAGAAEQDTDPHRLAAAQGVKAAESAKGLNDAAASATRGILASMRDYYGVPREENPVPRDPRRPAAPTVLGEDIEPFTV